MACLLVFGVAELLYYTLFCSIQAWFSPDIAMPANSAHSITFMNHYENRGHVCSVPLDIDEYCNIDGYGISSDMAHYDPYDQYIEDS